MQIQIDSIPYLVDLKKLSAHLQSWYDANKHTSDTIKLDNGKVIDFSRKSVARIGFKTLMTPVLVGMIHMLYAMKKIEIPRKEKHEDLLDYTAMALLGFIGELDKDTLYVETVEGDNSNSRRVKSIATYAPIPITAIGGNEREWEDKEVSAGGEACFSGGTLGDGQDLPDESVDQEEVGGTAMAECLSSGHQETG